jgi:hypothetical protein
MATRDREEVTAIAAASAIEIWSGIAPISIAIDDTTESNQGSPTARCGQTPCEETEPAACVTSEEAAAARPPQLSAICDGRKLACLRLMNARGNTVRGSRTDSGHNDTRTFGARCASYSLNNQMEVHLVAQKHRTMTTM